MVFFNEIPPNINHSWFCSVAKGMIICMSNHIRSAKAGFHDSITSIYNTYLSDALVIWSRPSVRPEAGLGHLLRSCPPMLRRQDWVSASLASLLLLLVPLSVPGSSAGHQRTHGEVRKMDQNCRARAALCQPLHWVTDTHFLAYLVFYESNPECWIYRDNWSWPKTTSRSTSTLACTTA